MLDDGNEHYFGLRGAVEHTQSLLFSTHSHIYGLQFNVLLLFYLPLKGECTVQAYNISGPHLKGNQSDPSPTYHNSQTMDQ